MATRDAKTGLPEQLRKRHLAEFEESFPLGTLVRDFFRAAGSDPVYARRAGKGSSTSRWWLLVRLAPALEARFGITREFLVYCTTFEDLQVRSIQEVQKLIEAAPRQIVQDFACIVTRDPLAGEKLRDWAPERSDGLLLVPLIASELDELRESVKPASGLPSVLSQWLFSRNLYDERTPVSGDHFFGRNEALGHLLTLLQQGAHAGVFGLRKIGKTSLLFRLRDAARAGTANILAPYVDLQGSSAANSAAHIAFEFATALHAEARQKDPRLAGQIRAELDLPRSWVDRPERELVTGVFDAVRRLLTGPLQSWRIAMILDEAEILVPSQGDPPALALEFLRGARATAQQTQRFSLILAGVNAYPCETPVLSGHDNPLFSLLTPLYLGPLDDAACQDLIRRIGVRVGLRWDATAVAAVVDAVGGHPLLARLAAGDVANSIPESSRPCAVHERDCTDFLADFHRQHSSELREMTESLRRYYPEEYEVLEMIASGHADEARLWATELPETVRHLEGYGVVDLGEGSVAIPVLERWLGNKG